MLIVAMPPVSTRADWIGYYQIEDDGALISVEPDAATVEIRASADCAPLLSATKANGKVTFPEASTLQWHFTRDEMAGLAAGIYEFGITVEMSGVTYQLAAGTVPVRDGVVAR